MTSPHLAIQVITPFTADLNIELHEQFTPTNPDGFFADVESNSAAVSVRVALRVRPLNAREVHENSKVCVEVSSNTVSIGKDRGFTFDKAFDVD